MTHRTIAAVTALTAAIALAGCGAGASRSPRVSAPVASPAPPGTTSAAVAQTRGAIVQALGAVNLVLDEPRVPFRPAESPALARAPREVFQVVLPDDPAHGFVSVYEFPTVPEAAAAGLEQANYVASGPGRVQFPPDAQFVLRQVGTTVVFHVFSPGASTDARAADIVVALQSLGDAVPFPR